MRRSERVRLCTADTRIRSHRSCRSERICTAAAIPYSDRRTCCERLCATHTAVVHFVASLRSSECAFALLVARSCRAARTCCGGGAAEEGSQAACRGEAQENAQAGVCFSCATSHCGQHIGAEGPRCALQHVASSWHRRASALACQQHLAVISHVK